jgi:hypothetical protein
VSSPTYQTSVSRNAALRFPRAFDAKKNAPASTAGSPGVTALSVEFVAKPQETHRVQSAIPHALAGALLGVSGFAGCLVMISEQEARLVTVITLWVGNERLKQCRENARWVHRVLAPCVDRCLRVQILAAYLPALPGIGLEMDLESEYTTKLVLRPTIRMEGTGSV